MDYELISLETISKLPNKLKAALEPSIEVKDKNIHEGDVAILKQWFKDELYESDQIQHMKRMAPSNRQRRKKTSPFEVLNQSSRDNTRQSGIANTSGNYLNEDLGNSLLLAEEDGVMNEEENEVEQRHLVEDLTDIFMDIGPASRELAPLKLKRPEKLMSKTLVKVPRANDDNHLFNNHMFHHMLGLSNLNKGKD